MYYKHIDQMHQFYFKNKDGLVLLIKVLKASSKKWVQYRWVQKRSDYQAVRTLLAVYRDLSNRGGPAAGIWVRHSTINYSSHRHLHSLSTRI